MERKKLYHPGDLITTFMGEIGIVVSRETLASLRTMFKEGNRPGHYFAPGCCHNPDYVTQIPIFFEDGTFDVMRTMNISKNPGIPEEKKHKLLETMGVDGV
ncbi:MAG: hypothetical protein JRJ51_08105 [Deltaproteobacteria bacterium]|nr:hypothetical protein [Deltaproteobacteria bacterium]MBW1942783.1 hypothetical protein [Deltaproteobacteria bacterium]